MSTPIVRKVGAAVAVSSVGALPVLLLGGLAVLPQDDLAFGEAELGTAVAAYFMSAALAAAPAGRLAERFAPRTVAWLGLACTAGSLLGIGLVANSSASLVCLLAFGGLGAALATVGTAVLVARGVAVHRQGVSFGVTQAAFPLAALLTGLSVPTIALTLGWRWPFILGAVAAPLAAAVMPAGDARRSGDRSREGDAPIDALILLALGMGLASAGGSSSATFIMASSVDRGVAPADAGLVLATGSFAGLAARIFVGWLADRFGQGPLLLVAILMAVGAVGYVGLAFSESPALIVFFTTLAFSGGWGWPGLILLATSRASPAAPGIAIGVVFVGGMAGAVVGPLVFGSLAEHVAFSVSWFLMATMALVGVGAILLSHQRTLRPRPSLGRQ